MIGTVFSLTSQLWLILNMVRIRGEGWTVVVASLVRTLLALLLTDSYSQEGTFHSNPCCRL